jgi:hypothetical protein
MGKRKPLSKLTRGTQEREIKLCETSQYYLFIKTIVCQAISFIKPQKTFVCLLVLTLVLSVRLISRASLLRRGDVNDALK